jgi:hypothetical protein
MPDEPDEHDHQLLLVKATKSRSGQWAHDDYDAARQGRQSSRAHMHHPQAHGSQATSDFEARWADDHKLRVQQCQPEGAKSRVVPLIALNRKSVEYIRLLVIAGRNALLFFGRHLHQRLFGFRFGVRLTRLGRDLSVRHRLGLSREYSLRCHAGAGAGAVVRVFVASLSYRGAGRPVRWLVTITGASLCSSVASATNSNATSTEPTTAKKARTGIGAREPSLNSRRKQDGDRSMASKCTKGNAAKCPWFPELQFHF